MTSMMTLNDEKIKFYSLIYFPRIYFQYKAWVINNAWRFNGLSLFFFTYIDKTNITEFHLKIITEFHLNCISQSSKVEAIVC